MLCFFYTIFFCEKEFGILNNLYLKEKNRVSFDLIKSEVVKKLNFDEYYKNFQNFLQSPQALNNKTKNVRKIIFN